MFDRNKARYIRAKIIQRKQGLRFLEAWAYAWQPYAPPSLSGERPIKNVRNRGLPVLHTRARRQAGIRARATQPRRAGAHVVHPHEPLR